MITNKWTERASKSGCEQCAAVMLRFYSVKKKKLQIIMKTAYKDDTLGKTQVNKGFSSFKSWETTIDGKQRSEHPSMSRTDKNVTKIRALGPFCLESLGVCFKGS